MTAFVLPDVDRSTIDDLRKRLPNLREIELPNLKDLDLSSLKELELPKMQQVGRNADAAVDKLLGRSRNPIWPWVAAGIGLVALAGVIGAYFAWFRRPTWEFTTSPGAPGTTPEPFETRDPLDATTDLTASASEAPIEPISRGTPFEEA